MFKNIKFENFKGFTKCELNNMSQITLISGKNNSGKSSVLEGMFLFIDHASPDSFYKLNRFRGITEAPNSTGVWESAFYDNTKGLKIVGDFGDGPTSILYTKDDSFVPFDPNMNPDILNQFITSVKSAYSLMFEYQNDQYTETGHFIVSQAGLMRNIQTSQDGNIIKPMPHAQYINNLIATTDESIVEWFGQIELKGQVKELIETLKIIEPCLDDISAIFVNGKSQLFGKVNGKWLSLKQAGDGISRLLYIMLVIMSNPQSFILVDEIENGFHYSIYEKLWKVIIDAAKKNNCQLIVTTHSYDNIVAAVEAVESMSCEDLFCYYRMDKSEQGCFGKRFSFEQLKNAVLLKLEVR